MNRFEALFTLPSPSTLTLTKLTPSDISPNTLSSPESLAANRCLDWTAGLLAGPGTKSTAATFAPVHYQEGYAYPLLVWLHGPGQTERQLAEFMAHYSTQNYVAVAPKSPVRDAANPWPQTSLAMDAAEDSIFDAIEAAEQRFSVHGEKVFLAGVGAGGTAALRTALAYPERFAGVASFDGGLPTGGAPLSQVGGVRELPIFLGSGQESDSYAVSEINRDLRLLHAADAKVHMWHEAGDGEITKQMLAEANRWMMDVACGNTVIA